MKKRLLLLAFLRRLLIGDQPAQNAVPDDAHDQTTATPKIPTSATPQAPTSETPAPAQEAPALDPSSLPSVATEIRELLASTDWDEVNQGLELLAASHTAPQLAALAGLIDACHLQIRDLTLWRAVLGIPEIHALNAAAKLAGLSGSLAALRRISLNRCDFPDSELCLDLALLDGAQALEELVVNGVGLQNPGALAGLGQLRKLVLASDSIGWEGDESDRFADDLSSLRFLGLANCPWEDLEPLAGCRSLEHLSLRGGELNSLQGIEALPALRSLTLHDCYNLSDLDGLESLSQLEDLNLRNLSIDAIDAVAGLSSLRQFSLEASEPVDCAPLAGLPALQSVEIDCSEATGLGSLAACPRLRDLKLTRGVPDHACGSPRLRLGDSEMATLMTCWKDVHRLKSKISHRYADAGDLGVFLLGLSLFDCLSAQISLAEFREQLELLSRHHGDQLRRRCHWPWSADGYSSSHPVGQWIDRVRRAGALSVATCTELATALAERLPPIPVR